MPLLRIITLTISLVAAIIFIALMDRVLPPAAASVLLDNTRASWPFTVQNGLWIAFFIGLGELSVGIGFGVLPVAGAAWLQSGTIDSTVIIFSLPVSAWVTAILLINEVPDIAADGATGKRTLPVRFGLGGTALIYLGLHLLALGATTWLAFAGALPLLAPVVPAGLILLAFRAALAIRTGVTDRKAMTAAIEATLGIHTLGSIWLVLVVLYVAFFGAT